jgi:hypothetical protein
MRFDDFMYGGDMYGGDMFGAYGGADLPSFAVEPPAPAPAAAPSLSVTPPGAYSQATQAQLDEQNAYLADYIARTGYDTALARPYQTTVRRGYGDKDIATISTGEPLAEKYKQPQQISEEEAAAMLSEAPPLEQRLVSSFAPETNQGQSGGRLAAKYNTPFRLYDGKELVYEGVGPEAAAEAARLAEQISKEKGAKADWSVKQQFGDNWVTASKDQPDVQGGLLGAVLKYGLPLAASFIPGLNVLATMAVAGAASTGGNLLAGESLKNSLISGGLSAATAGLMKGIAPGAPAGPKLSDTFNAARGAGGALTDVFATSGLGAIGGAAGQAAAQSLGQLAPAAIGGGLSQVAPSLTDEIVVSALKGAAPSLLSQVAPSVVQAGVSGLGQSLLPSQQATTQTSLAAQEPPPSLAVSPDELAGITVTGSVPSSNAFPSLAAGVSGVGNLGLKLATDQIAAEQQAAEQQRADEDRMITVTSTTPPPSSAVVPSLAVPAMAALPSLAAATAQPTPATTTAPPEEEPLTVTTSKLSPSIIPSVAAAALPPLATALTPATPASTTPQDTLYTGDEPMITATATKVPTTLVPSVVTAAGGAALADALTTPEPATTTPDKKLSVSDYLRLAGLASSALGLLGGSGGPEGTAAGIVPGGLGRLNPIFSAKLPTGADVNIPGGVGAASNLAARPVTDEDWLTYGQRPEKSFFNYVPQPPTGMAHGGSLEAKRGGRPSRSSFAVNGPGTGRSDDIPAVLSDGEYVIDAETVALLGDGSSKAGAQKLDDLRVKIRKHKGQRLSQGRFSSDAKKPEAYLTGGRI